MVMFLSGQGGLTDSTVAPSRNPPHVLQWDHHMAKRPIKTSSLREGKPWQIKLGQRMLLASKSSMRGKLGQENQCRS